MNVYAESDAPYKQASESWRLVQPAISVIPLPRSLIITTYHSHRLSLPSGKITKSLPNLLALPFLSFPTKTDLRFD